MNRTTRGTALRRRGELERLLRETGAGTQEALLRRMRGRGFAVTQPTLSRDLRRLGAVRTARGYALPGAAGPEPAPPGSRAAKLDRLLREFVLSVERAGNLLVLKTPPADAHPVARALDERAFPQVAGSIAGDDTIFIATRGAAAAARLAGRIRLALGEPGTRRPSARSVR